MVQNLHGTPQFSKADVIACLQAHFGIAAQVKPLPSERDQTFRVLAQDDSQYVFKVANSTEDPEFLDAQCAMLAHVSRSVEFCPSVVTTLDGKSILQMQGPETSHHAQLLRWIPGVPLGQIRWQCGALFEDLGYKLGRMDCALQSFDHVATHRDFHWDLARAKDVIAARFDLIDSAALRPCVERIVELHCVRVTRHESALRASVVHGDANDHNVICGGTPGHQNGFQTVAGIIDFGDVVRTHTICNLAIAVAYALLQDRAPLSTAGLMVRGYHRAFELMEVEVEVLWALVLSRLATSVCVAAEQMALRPDDPYLAISQNAIAARLPVLLDIPYDYATAVLRQSAGFPPVRNAPAIRTFLQQTVTAPAPLLGETLTADNTLCLDLGIETPLLEDDPIVDQGDSLSIRIAALMAERGKSFAIGRYDEARLIYTDDMFNSGPHLLDERRTIHTGLDIFTPSGTAVYAPIAGHIHSMRVSLGEQDYGHVILLQHETDDAVKFWTLYGHLAARSFDGQEIGQAIAAGQRFAYLGEHSENGNWPPHLHFQLVTHLLDFADEFPGVGFASARSVWRSLSPDPVDLAGVPRETLPRVSNENGIRLVRRWGRHLWNSEGQMYLDAGGSERDLGAVVLLSCDDEVFRYLNRKLSVLAKQFNVVSALKTNETHVEMLFESGNACASNDRGAAAFIEQALHEQRILLAERDSHNDGLTFKLAHDFDHADADHLAQALERVLATLELHP